MGMSTYIQAFMPDTDADFQKHKKILLMCHENNVSLPKETEEYFGTDYISESTLEEKLQIELKEGTHYKEYSKDMEEGFEIDLDSLPKGIKIIRFVNSY